jgi:hypothetical protein
MDQECGQFERSVTPWQQNHYRLVYFPISVYQRWKTKHLYLSRSRKQETERKRCVTSNEQYCIILLLLEMHHKNHRETNAYLLVTLKQTSKLTL